VRKKVTIVGAGHVGESCAVYLAEKNICDITVIDIVEDMPQGKSLDLSQAGPIVGYDCKVEGMSREDLLNKNANIIKGMAEAAKKYAPNSMILMVANPLDIIGNSAFL